MKTFHLIRLYYTHHSCPQTTSLVAGETACQLQTGCLCVSAAVKPNGTVSGRRLWARLKHWSTL